MRVVGTASIFLRELLPDYQQYLPDLLALSIDVWPMVKLSGLSNRVREPDITALLYLELRDAIEERGNVPFYVWAEVQDFNPISGKQFKRPDIEFHPTGLDWRIHGQKPYLVLEGKCLRVTQQATFRPNTSEYIKEMSNFVNDTKHKHPAFCAMLGYVMDGQVLAAFESLQDALKKSSMLGLRNSDGITVCANMPHPPHGCTQHDSSARDTNALTIYHLILAATIRPQQPATT